MTTPQTRILVLVLLWVSVLLLAGCTTVRSSDRLSVVQSGQLPLPDTTSPSGAYIGVPDYRIGPLDKVEITVFQVPDLTRTVRVNSSGDISLPMIGLVRAGGKTVQELENLIAEMLRERVMQDPQVSVFIEEYKSQRITVEGSVTDPGVKALTGRTSLLQVIARSGGLTRMADPKKIILFRTINGQRMAALFNLVDIRSGVADDPEVFGEDVIVVDDSRFLVLTETLRNWLGFRPVGI